VPATTRNDKIDGGSGLTETWPEQDFQPEYALLVAEPPENTDALHNNWPKALWTSDAHVVLFRSRDDSGLLQQALSYWSALADRVKCTLGAEHPNTLAARNNHALARLQPGDPAGAATAYDALLPDLLRLRGPEHPGSRMLETERKLLTHAIQMSAYNSKSALARLLHPHYSRGQDEARFTAARGVHPAR
jgi:hypothetical protein